MSVDLYNRCKVVVVVVVVILVSCSNSSGSGSGGGYKPLAEKIASLTI